jgi:hypothetical protein
MNTSLKSSVRALIERGAVVPCPECVQVGEEVNPERIAPGVVAWLQMIVDVAAAPAKLI